MNAITSLISYTLILGLSFGPILTHIVYCFQTEKYILLLAGTLIFPVGWFHGLGRWFGFW